MQDTTSSAMTEVALGLSMAFFTLLIVSLLSMSFPTKIDSNATKPTEFIQKNSAVDIEIDSEDKSNSQNETQFAFFFDDKFYDPSLALRSINSFSKEKNLIIAVNPNLTFAEVFTLRQQVKHPKLSITVSNKAWRSRLQQMTISD
jgi:hypothetical protein|uniref:Biopolymer transport protein ExbD/TolR n=1 Tax=Colwellia sp. C1 TaxID=1737566 RepID=A0A161IA47_9GAMM|nr:hypothetical protein [Colwellia sp. C1]